MTYEDMITLAVEIIKKEVRELQEKVKIQEEQIKDLNRRIDNYYKETDVSKLSRL